MDRRGFIRTIGVASASALAVKKLDAAEPSPGDKELAGVLVDTTRCVGCRTCEQACAEANGLPLPNLEDTSVFDKERKTSETQYAVVNRYQTQAGEVFAKKQCMHCNIPSCASACLVKAMLKTKEGPVIWRGKKCMGCRFCMLSCPFDMPKVEYHSANPKIMKCNMCWNRVKEGQKPACVEACPAEALHFAKRRELVEIANERIYAEPAKYHHEIYGEHEVGGTGMLYIASVPFEQIGFRTDLGTTPCPEYTKDFLYAVPLVLILWPALLIAISSATKRIGKD